MSKNWLKLLLFLISYIFIAQNSYAQIVQLDSIQKDKPADLKTTVAYSAKDSTILEADSQIVQLYGNAKVIYGDIALEANYIRLDYAKNEVYATGTYDSVSKKEIGLPVFTQGEDKYDAKVIRYNFKTEKAIIKEIVTTQGDGFVQGENVKKDPEDNLYIRDAIYTTCNLEQPHFNIRARKIKMVGKKEIISGPFNFELNDIPLPIGLPFGFFPYQKPKKEGNSGILFPVYGEEPSGRGFYLREGGYYWAASENIGMRFTGQIYSKGGWGLGLNTQYNKRYHYTGSFNFAFNKNTDGAEFNPQKRNDFTLQWAHSPKSYGNSNFSASVNLASNSYNQFNTYNTQQYLSNAIGSSIQYSYNLGQVFRSGISFRVNQNTSTKIMNAGTQFNLGINQFQPFKNPKRVTEKFWDQFRVGLDFSGSVSVSNQINNPYQQFQFEVYPRSENSLRGTVQRPYVPTSATDLPPGVIPVNGSNIATLLNKAQTTFNYSLPISLPNIKINRYVNLTPGMSWSGKMFTRSYNYTYVEADSSVRIDTLRGLPKFNSQISFSASANTRLYGTLRFGNGRLQAIRHVMAPSISVSYTPDYSDPSFGYFQDVRINNRKFTNKDGVEQVGDIMRISSFDPSQIAYRGANGSVSFGIQNTIEAKLKSKSDTASEATEKIKLIDNFTINGSYNLLAYEFPLSNLNFSANSKLRKFDIVVGGSIDPYLWVEDASFAKTGRRTPDLMIKTGQGLGRLSRLNFSLGKNFRPEGADKKKESNLGSDAQLEQINRNLADYVDWNIPWSFGFSYQFSLNRLGLAQAQTISGLTFQGDFSLSPKWKFTYSSGYDFKFNAVTYTNISIHRDLHCWELNINWTPIASPYYGRASNYSFDLRVKSSLLQDLKISRRRSFYDKGGF